MSVSFAITGMYRSGTTLVEKWLNTQQGMTVYSQPFPFLFYEAKQSFYKAILLDDPVPMNVMFPRKYPEGLREQFLKGFTFDADQQARILKQNSAYSGCMTPAAHKLKAKEGMRFEQLIKEWVSGLDDILDKDGSDRTGFKEVVIEEFIPQMLSMGMRVVLVVRNLPDVLVSLNYGSGNEFTGGIRPTLFNVRQWRKTVAYTLHFRRHPRVMVVRYEDFLSDTEVRQSLCDFLGMEMTHADTRSLQEADGSAWRANSSFSEMAKPTLPKEVEDYVHALAGAELQAMGYETRAVSRTEELVNQFSEPWQVMDRPYLPAYYSTNQGHIHEEINRLKILHDADFQAKVDDWFIFDDILAELKKVIK
jgi:hypothetical protein